MKGNNIVQLIGYVGKDLVVHHTGNTKKLVIRVSTHERFTDPTGRQIDTTYWHTVVAWGTLADNAENLFVRGSHILVQGKLIHRSYNDRVGHRRYVTEVRADHLENLDR